MTTLRRLAGFARSMSSRSAIVQLNPTEAVFIDHLDAFSRTFTPPVECRIAGGWVRDKLLSLPSSDLDVALSIPSGHSFAVAFVDYLKGKDVQTGSVGKVSINPEQSKHLETGTTKIMGLDCDFVGLRSETYADSRIPTEIRLGTPLEDASRRDLTVNALFYNVHSKEVEDFTGHGLQDLAKKIARTPLAPIQTFQDDPLRVIRCVRFASRFGLQIEADVACAMQDEEIKSALSSKVSRERVGIEVMKMIQKTPFEAMALIDSLGLHPSIFTSTLDPSRANVMTVCTILFHVLERDFKGDEILWLAAATSPFRDLTVKSKKVVPAVAIVLSEGLKTSNDIRDAVTRLFDAPRLIAPHASKRSDIGVMLQHPSIRPWTRSIVWAIVMAILPEWSGAWDSNAERILSQYLSFIEKIDDLNLPTDIDNPPLLDGTDIQNILDVKPSPMLAVAREAVNVWQLDNPQASKLDCEAWLREMWATGCGAEWEKMAANKTKRKR